MLRFATPNPFLLNKICLNQSAGKLYKFALKCDIFFHDQASHDQK